MSHGQAPGEEPTGLEGYAAYDQQNGNVQDEWMQRYFQPTGFAPVTHHVPVDGGLYASYASDVSDISVASIADDMYDPALIPQGFEAPMVFDNYAYGGYMPEQYMVVQQPRQMVRQVQVPQEYYVEEEVPMMQYHQQPMQHVVQQRQVPRVAQHQLPSQVQIQAPQQTPFAPAPEQPPANAQWAQIGVSIWQKGSWHVIASVTPGSSAQTMGLQPGDVLRKLDRVPVKGWDHDSIMSKLQGWEGTSVIVRTNTKKLRVIRDCGVQERQVAARPQPQPAQQMVQQPVQQFVQQPVQQFVQQPVQRMVQQPQIQFVQQPVQRVVQQIPVPQQQFVVQQPMPQQMVIQQPMQQQVIQQPMQQQVIRQVVQVPQQPQFVKTVQAMPPQFAPGQMPMPGQQMMMRF